MMTTVTAVSVSANTVLPKVKPKKGMTVTIPSYPYNLTDFGNAERFLAMHTHEVRFMPEWGKWIIWDGRHWEGDKIGTVTAKMQNVIRGLFAEAERLQTSASTYPSDNLAYAWRTQAAALVRHATFCETASRVSSALKCACVRPGMALKTTDLDTYEMLFNCANGIIDLTTGALIPHDSSKLLTKLSPIDYLGTDCDISKHAPTWLRFLSDITCQDKELEEYLQRIIGYTLTGSVKEQVLFLLYGKGSNGKSVFLEIIKAIMGDSSGYAQQADFTTFLETNNTGPRNDVARMVGVRFLSASEAPEGKRLNETLVKQITGGDTITARFLNQEFFDFVPTLKLFLASNYRPVVSGTDHGIWRRMQLVPFSAQFKGSNRDLSLKDKLTAELPAILSWAVQGCLKWQKDGLQVPKAVAAATLEYRGAMDILQGFLDDCCQIDENNPAAKTSAQNLFDAYLAWAQRHGHKMPMKLETFKERMESRGMVQKRNNVGRFWQGVTLKPTTSAPPGGATQGAATGPSPSFSPPTSSAPSAPPESGCELGSESGRAAPASPAPDGAKMSGSSPSFPGTLPGEPLDFGMD